MSESAIAYNTATDAPAKSTNAKGTGFEMNIDGTKSYVEYADTGAITAGGKDVTLTEEYVKVTVTKASDPTDTFKVTTVSDATGVDDAAGTTYVAVNGNIVVTATGTNNDVNVAISDADGDIQTKTTVNGGASLTKAAKEKDVTVAVTNS